MLGGEGTLAAMPELDETIDATGQTRRILTGDYASAGGRWQMSRLPSGRPLPTATPLFRKLEAAISDEEVERMAQRAGAQARNGKR
jgi:methionyl-tRNA synthetase